MVLAILWCTDVFAHLEGGPRAHFQPGKGAGGTYTFGTVTGIYKADPCLRMGKGCGGDGKIPFPYEGGHGHIDSGTSRSWGYWTCGGYAAAMRIDDPDCPTASDGSVDDSGDDSGDDGGDDSVDDSDDNGGNSDRNPSPRPSIPSIITTSTTIRPPRPPVSSWKPTLVKISGDNQEGPTAQALANPFVIEVHDGTGIPLERVIVRFTVLTGGGSLSATALSTNSAGRAASTLTLGRVAGTNTVRASVRGISKTLVFTAEGISSAPSLPVPTTLTIVSGNNQSGVIGGMLANPFVVEVQDGNSDPSVGIAVTFAVTTGGGSLNPETIVTRPDGRAASTLTLGWSTGTNSVQVSAEGVSQTVTFNATAQAPVFDLSVPSGISLVHVPLKVTSVDGGGGHYRIRRRPL